MQDSLGFNDNVTVSRVQRGCRGGKVTAVQNSGGGVSSLNNGAETVKPRQTKQKLIKANQSK
jgi:hypothetical protein